MAASASMLAEADGLIFLLAFLAGTYVSWWALGQVRWDKFVFDPFAPQTRMLRFLLAMAGGLLCGLIAILYVAAAQMFRLMLQA